MACPEAATPQGVLRNRDAFPKKGLAGAVTSRSLCTETRRGSSGRRRMGPTGQSDLQKYRAPARSPMLVNLEQYLRKRVWFRV